MPVRYILSSVWARLIIFSPLSIIQNVWLCVFSLPIHLVMIERTYILCLIIIKSKVWTITHCLGLGHEKWCSHLHLHFLLGSGGDNVILGQTYAKYALMWTYGSLNKLVDILQRTFPIAFSWSKMLNEILPSLVSTGGGPGIHGITNICDGPGINGGPCIAVYYG